jgi:hypothetical protein
MIDLNILKENPELAKSLKLEITGADLLAFGESIHKRAIESEKNTHKDPEEYLTPQQFSDALQISLVTLWSYDKRGVTRPLRIGNAKRYRRSDLEKILCNA